MISRLTIESLLLRHENYLQSNCLYAISFFFEVEGQIVNIENQRLTGNKEGWSGNLDLSFSFISNPKEIIQFGNNNKVGFRRGDNYWMGLSSFGFVRADGENFVNNGFQHIRYSRNLKRFRKIYLEGFEQIQYNRVQRIKLRMLLGGGGRATVIDKDSISLNVGAFLMGEYEEETGDVYNSHIRHSTFVSFDFQFNKTTGINSIVYYQPDFFYPVDYRLSTATTLRFSINTHMRFKLVYNLSHDEFPPVGAPKTVYSLLNVFEYSF